MDEKTQNGQRKDIYTCKSTAAYLAEKESKTGLISVPLTVIAIKSPDGSMDFCAFVLLKRALGRRHHEHWNDIEENPRGRSECKLCNQEKFEPDPYLRKKTIQQSQIVAKIIEFMHGNRFHKVQTAFCKSCTLPLNPFRACNSISSCT